MNLQKASGQFFRPKAIVKQMLAICQFESTNILKQKIIDNSCGDGTFLQVIVKKIIKVAIALNYSKQAIATILTNNVMELKLIQLLLIIVINI